MHTGERSTVLCCLTAAILALLLFVQLCRLFDVPSAQAEMVAGTGSISALTVDAVKEEVLVVLDARTEMLQVYRSDPQQGVQLLQTLSVRQLFAEARARAQGRP
jgi:hypothetical protein